MSEALLSRFMQLPLGGRSIEVAAHTLPSASSTILLLHEALGSVSYWKDFPQKLALATGANVLLYSRPGHGNSEGPLEPRGKEHYLRQIEVVIPALLRRFSIDCPVVYGHSEGAGIAMLYAASSNPVKALIVESPFVIPEKSASRVVEKMAAEYPGSKLQSRLGQYHQDPDAVFHAWVRWASAQPEDISLLQHILPRIACPVLVLQGANDEFGADTHLRAIQSILPGVQNETFSNTGHLPHREATDLLLNRVVLFLTGLHDRAGSCTSSIRSTLIEEPL
jgi:pimeloyl-ACP methyl ester carboxylesterase